MKKLEIVVETSVFMKGENHKEIMNDFFKMMKEIEEKYGIMLNDDLIKTHEYPVFDDKFED